MPSWHIALHKNENTQLGCVAAVACKCLLRLLWPTSDPAGRNLSAMPPQAEIDIEAQA